MCLTIGEKVYIKEQYRDYVNPMDKQKVTKFRDLNSKIWTIFDYNGDHEEFKPRSGTFTIECEGMMVLNVPEQYLESVTKIREDKINQVINGDK